jgi:secreted trypsin-like serine protease
VRAIACAAVLLFGCNALEVEDRTERTSSPVFGGAADPATESVVALLDGPLDGPHDLCSATIVAPRVALTAAHCVLDASKSYHLRFGSMVSAASRAIEVKEVHRHPSFTAPGDDQRAGFDLAVLVLAEDAGVAAMPLASEPDGVATSVELVGFGVSELADAASIGARHRVTAPVVTTCDRLLGLGDETHGVCGGDSGGAVIREGKLVGVIGFGLRPACAPPGWATRVAPYARWIASFSTAAPDPTCASTCPEPGHCDATQGVVDAGADAGADAGPSHESPETSSCAASRAGSTSSFAWSLALVALLLGRRARLT